MQATAITMPCMGSPVVCHVRTNSSAADLGTEILSLYPNLCLQATAAETSAGAGNSNEDACGWSPAGAPGVIAVGAVDSQMRRWYSSNWYLLT